MPHVTKFIELLHLQCEEFVSKGVVDDLRPLLIKAGNTLAPDYFLLAMDGSPVPPDPSTLALESDGSLTAAGNLDNQMPMELEGNNNNMAAGSDSNAADGQGTVTTETTDELQELEPQVISILIEKGRKLQQHKAVGQHTKKYLSDLGSADVMKRCVS